MATNPSSSYQASILRPVATPMRNLEPSSRFVDVPLGVGALDRVEPMGDLSSSFTSGQHMVGVSSTPLLLCPHLAADLAVASRSACGGSPSSEALSGQFTGYPCSASPFGPASPALASSAGFPGGLARSGLLQDGSWAGMAPGTSQDDLLQIARGGVVSPGIGFSAVPQRSGSVPGSTRNSPRPSLTPSWGWPADKPLGNGGPGSGFGSTGSVAGSESANTPWFGQAHVNNGSNAFRTSPSDGCFPAENPLDREPQGAMRRPQRTKIPEQDLVGRGLEPIANQSPMLGCYGYIGR